MIWPYFTWHIIIACVVYRTPYFTHSCRIATSTCPTHILTTMSFMGMYSATCRNRNLFNIYNFLVKTEYKIQKSPREQVFKVLEVNIKILLSFLVLDFMIIHAIFGRFYFIRFIASHLASKKPARKIQASKNTQKVIHK